MNVYLDVPGIATRSQPTAMIIISTSNPIFHSLHASVSVQSQDVGSRDFKWCVRTLSEYRNVLMEIMENERQI